MMELLKAGLLFSFSLGCWTCLNLLLSRRGEPVVKYAMLAFVALLLVPPINAYVAMVRGYPLNFLLVLSHNLTWTYGPIALVLIERILLQPIPRKGLLLHLVPFVFFYNYELAGAQWVNPWLLVMARFVQVFAYLAYGMYRLVKHRRRLLALGTQHKNTTYYWSLYLIAGLLIAMLLDVAVVLALASGFIQELSFLAVIGSIMAIYVNTIALFAVYQPETFIQVTETIENAPVPDIKPALRSIELSPVAVQELDKKLQALVQTHKPHLDDEISLNKLASLLGVSSHQLSELLNVHKSTSFYDFLNDLRHQESIKLLTNPHFELTIADIAYQSGFNNRNTFYKVFKEKTGVTPVQYKKSAAS